MACPGCLVAVAGTDGLGQAPMDDAMRGLIWGMVGLGVALLMVYATPATFGFKRIKPRVQHFSRARMRQRLRS